MKPATEILLSAAFVLTPRENWFGKGCPDDRSGRMCAAIALEDATTTLFPTQEHSALLQAVRRELLKAVGLPHDGYCYAASIFVWNDTHTHAEVLAALYKAAELSEES